MFLNINRSNGIPFVFLLSVFAAYFCIVLFPARAHDFFYTATIFSVLGIIQDRRSLRTDVLLPLALAAFAVGRFAWLAWSGMPQDPGDAHIYGMYRHTAKYTFWAAPMIFYACNLSRQDRLRLPASCCSWLMIGVSLAISLQAFHEYWGLNIERVVVGLDVATVTAYMLGIVHLLALHRLAISYGIRRERWIGPVLALCALLAIQYTSILLTGTRSAMIVYPVFGMLILLAAARREDRRLVLIGTAIVFALLVALSYHKIVKPRIEDFRSDVASYQVKPSEVTSIGARFSMWQAGWYAANHRPLGERLGERSALLKGAVAAGELNSQALRFLDAHLHDDMLEVMSLQGFWGGALLLLVYASLLRQAWLRRGHARGGMLLVAGAAIAFGVGDVLMVWDKIVILLLLATMLIGATYPGDRAGEN